LGFAVVAEEVRSLAQKCAQAAKDTAVLIEESISKSNEGTATLSQVNEAIRAVTENAAKVKELVNEVNRSSQEQARGIDQISQAFVQIEKITQGSAAGAQQSASASEELNSQANSLNDIVVLLHDMVGGAVQAAALDKKRGGGDALFGSHHAGPRARATASNEKPMHWPAGGAKGAGGADKNSFSLDDFREI
jgi:methyl-accepting chemotaxis protein/methyl-accepting chemotaxis protein-1 (serine sensor receptor)